MTKIASVVVASQSTVDERGIRPLARIVSWGVAGVDPAIMGIGPAPAIRQALEKAKLTIAEMDVVEVNEAFAAQYTTQLRRSLDSIVIKQMSMGGDCTRSSSRCEWNAYPIITSVRAQTEGRTFWNRKPLYWWWTRRSLLF